MQLLCERSTAGDSSSQRAKTLFVRVASFARGDEIWKKSRHRIFGENDAKFRQVTNGSSRADWVGHRYVIVNYALIRVYCRHSFATPSILSLVRQIETILQSRNTECPSRLFTKHLLEIVRSLTSVHLVKAIVTLRTREETSARRMRALINNVRGYIETST